MKLTKTEESYLIALQTSPDGVSRKDLAKLGESPTDEENGWYASNAVDVHIKNLRRKVPDTEILTIRGFGYKIA